MDIQGITAARNYSAFRDATRPEPGEHAQPVGALEDFAATLTEAEEIAKQAMIGDADPHSLVQALAQTELAVETAVTVRNKVVEAYQEILRMPV